MKHTFTIPGFRRLYAGMAASMLGDSVMLLVLSMWVKELTGSNSQAGLTFLFMMLPALAAPALGVWLDRLPRKPVLVWGSVASALMMAPLGLVRDAGDVWIVWLVAAGYGVSFIILPAALSGLLKEMVPEESLVEANAALQTTKEAYRLVGPLIGAGLFAWLGGAAVAAVDALSFLVAAAIIAGITVTEAVPDQAGSHFWTEFTAGVRHLIGDRVLAHTLLGFGICLLVLGFTEASIYALLDAFGRPPTYAAVLVSVMGVGAIIGGLASTRIVRRLGEPRAIALALIGFAVSVGGMAAASDIHQVLVIGIIAGAANPVAMVGFMTLLQRRTPQRLMGRVSAAVEVVFGVPQALSLGLGAVLVAVLDWRIIFGVIAVVTAAGAAHILFWLRDERPATVPGAVDPTLDFAVDEV